MSLKRPRTLAALGFLAATGLFLTACGPEDEPSGSGGGTQESTEDTAEDGGREEGEVIGEGEGVNGTFTGVLTYLAPGELLVGDQAFYLSEETVIHGGEICGDPETPEAENCSVEDLESVAQEGFLNVEVTMAGGVAELVEQV